MTTEYGLFNDEDEVERFLGPDEDDGEARYDENKGPIPY
jgi:hypothetical protein